MREIAFLVDDHVPDETGDDVTLERLLLRVDEEPRESGLYERFWTLATVGVTQPSPLFTRRTFRRLLFAM